MRTAWCGELRAADEGRGVEVAGWVHSRRDHGGVIFLDLRDRSGLVQVVADPKEGSAAFEAAEKVRSEYVVSVAGKVRRRPEGTTNPNLDTGEVEVSAAAIEVLAEADTPPFVIEDGIEASEETRIRYRYLDLRRPEMQKMMRLRHQVISIIRSFFNEEGFVEVETPLLTKATPEGARDFLVPSRLEPGHFFALPQSPQLFKQLLMIAGFERYFQIARCLRDEDPRADRQPDFTQLDMEMSFVDEPVIQELTERLFARIMKETVGAEIPTPFPRITFEDSVARYGNDKPDLRFGLELVDVADMFRNTETRVIRSALDRGGSAKALRVEGRADMTRKEIEELVRVARNLGAGGMAWISFSGGEIASPLKSSLTDAEVEGLKRTTSASDGDLVLFVSDRKGAAEAALGAVRLELAGKLGLRPQLPPDDPGAWKFVWVVDPPLVEWNDEEKRWDAVHHPFTAPRAQDEAILESDPGAVKARAYDIVLNGWELATGSIRIHRPELQRRIFGLIGLTQEQVDRRFGWFLKAFDYGAPPHGGIAPGIDRVVALIAGKENIREAIAFPKTGAYTDPLTGAPDLLDAAQLKELGLRLSD